MSFVPYNADDPFYKSRVLPQLLETTTFFLEGFNVCGYNMVLEFQYILSSKISDL